MSPLPKRFSVAANAIRIAINDGRAEEAMHKLAALLAAGNADKAVQALAARWIETVGLRSGDAKALRSGHKALPEDWLNIAEMFGRLQDEGATYAEAQQETSKYFGCSERHVQACVAHWNSGKNIE
jgi:hypothetical protein